MVQAAHDGKLNVDFRLLRSSVAEANGSVGDKSQRPTPLPTEALKPAASVALTDPSEAGARKANTAQGHRRQRLPDAAFSPTAACGTRMLAYLTDEAETRKRRQEAFHPGRCRTWLLEIPITRLRSFPLYACSRMRRMMQRQVLLRQLRLSRTQTLGSDAHSSLPLGRRCAFRGVCTNSPRCSRVTSASQVRTPHTVGVKLRSRGGGCESVERSQLRYHCRQHDMTATVHCTTLHHNAVQHSTLSCCTVRYSALP